MAELVDALVSNTSAARHTGSIPVLGTKALEFFTQGLFSLVASLIDASLLKIKY